MRVTVASVRGILGGWLLKATLPLLVNPHAIAEWTAAGIGDSARIALAVVELLGAVLFAFERTAILGFLLLTLSFAYAVVTHIQHGEIPWWIVAYFVGSALMLFWTHVSRKQERGPEVK